MIVFEIFKEAFNSLWKNKGRTFLSVLGIIIGVGSVIAMMAIGNGAQSQITETISGLGTNLLTLNSRGSRALTMSDLEVILANDYNHVLANALPQVSSSQVLVANDTDETVSVTGVTDAYLDVESKTIAVGSFFTSDDFTENNRVVAIGNTTAETFFGSAQAAVGQKLKIGNLYFTVTGVFKQEGGSSGFSDPDDFAIIPLSVLQNDIAGSQALSAIVFKLSSEDQLEAAKSVIGYTMLQRHEIDSIDNADFGMFSASDLLEALTSVTQTMTLLLSGIAGISLLVGGIGIMNVMLMSVLERTREIGLRKALGARQIHLISQFLFEAVLITLVGGIIGLGLGLGVSTLMNKIFNVPSAATLESVIMSVSISTAIGLVFGIYPARKAAKLEPIDALRTE